jgi:hypothetical protein
MTTWTIYIFSITTNAVDFACLGQEHDASLAGTFKIGALHSWQLSDPIEGDDAAILGARSCATKPDPGDCHRLCGASETAERVLY